jgi:DNA-binding MarR family transcriptional regulator
MPSDRPNALDRLYARPGFLLRRAHQLSAAIFERECESIGLTPAQYSVLSALHVRPGQDQSSLARSLGFDKVTILRVLHAMEKRDLLSRSRLSTDRRSVSLTLTDEGRTLFALAQKPVDRAYKRLMAPLSEPQQKQLLQLLERLTRGLEAEARAPFVRAVEPATA